MGSFFGLVLLIAVLILLLYARFGTSDADTRPSPKRQRASVNSTRNKEPDFPTPPLRPIGHEEPVCPYCGIAPAKMPRKLRPCDSCGKVIYPRKRPFDGKVVFFREEELDDLEEQRAIAYGTYEFYAAEKKRRQDARNELRAKFGGEPKEADVTWSLLVKDSMTYINEKQWWGYIGTKNSMASFLTEEKRWKDALVAWFEVAILGIVDVRILSGLSDGESLNDILEFIAHMDGESAKSEEVDANVSDGILECCAEMHLTIEASRPMFDIAYRRTPMRSRLPVTQEELWATICRKLSNESSACGDMS